MDCYFKQIATLGVEIRDYLVFQTFNGVFQAQFLLFKPLQQNLILIGELIHFPDSAIQRSVLSLQFEQTHIGRK